MGRSKEDESSVVKILLKHSINAYDVGYSCRFSSLKFFLKCLNKIESFIEGYMKCKKNTRTNEGDPKSDRRAN